MVLLVGVLFREGDGHLNFFGVPEVLLQLLPVGLLSDIFFRVIMRLAVELSIVVVRSPVAVQSGLSFICVLFVVNNLSVL